MIIYLYLNYCDFFVLRTAVWQVMCVFKCLNKKKEVKHQEVEEEGFKQFYEFIDYGWSEVCLLYGIIGT